MVHALDPARPTPGRLMLPALCLGSFITTLLFAAPAPFLPAMSRDLGVSVALLGQVTATMMILSAGVALVVGPMADHFGAKPFILLGLAAAAVSFFDFALAPVFAVLLIAAIAGGIAEATVPGLSLAMAGSRFTGAASRRAMGWTVGALASAPIIGIPILTTIGDAAGWRVAFLAAGGAAVIVAILVAMWLPREPRPVSDALRWQEVFDAYRPLVHDAGMRRLFGSTITRSLCWLGLLTYLGALLADEFGLSTREIGLVYMLGGSGYFAGSLLSGGRFAHVAARRLVPISNLVMAVLLLVVFSAVLSTPLTVALITLAAFAAAVGWVALTTLITEETPAGAGTTLVLNMALFNVGASAGAGLGGILLAAGGFSAVGVVLALVGLLSAYLAWTPGRPAVTPAGT
jgi:MFS transporter, DHA1 family, inner membrane transport protein